jgi:pimeloyl-ACP methyl ester carboxylesterase
MPLDIERGDGPDLVLVPGIAGPWEYVGLAVDALAAHFRVVTFSLGTISEGNDVERDAERVKAVLDARGIDRAIVCGISYGGVVATCFAAKWPERTMALVVASAPGAGWHLRPRHEVYARWPRLFGPVFFAESPFRLRPELVAALPRRRDRLRFARWQIGTFFRRPISLPQLAARARALARHDIEADCRRVTAPTLVITGERALDRVVPVDSTATYTRLIPGARCVVLERTGHLGTITRPSEFAAMVHAFVAGGAESPALQASVARPFQGREQGVA